MRVLGTAASVLVVVAGCAVEGDVDPLASASFAARVCADGPTVPGIDVSKWQGSIDWDSVAGDGVRYAFIRTNHGLGDLDEKYAFNWAEARRVGILRGTYQYFLPGEDAVEQAQLLIDRMGPLEDDDLPPVLDVEEADGQPPEVIREKIHAWMNHVEAELGVVPIIYTAKYFWQDGVGMPDDFLDHPLWVANYDVECPLIADPWLRWDFWQHTSTGRVAGISGNVDRNHFNGTEDDLLAFVASTRITEPEPDPDPDPDPEPEPDPNGDPEPEPEDPGPDPEDLGAGDPGAPSLVGCHAAGTGTRGSAAAFLALAFVIARRRRR